MSNQGQMDVKISWSDLPLSINCANRSNPSMVFEGTSGTSPSRSKHSCANCIELLILLHMDSSIPVSSIMKCTRIRTHTLSSYTLYLTILLSCHRSQRNKQIPDFDVTVLCHGCFPWHINSYRPNPTSCHFYVPSLTFTNLIQCLKRNKYQNCISSDN